MTVTHNKLSAHWCMSVIGNPLCNHWWMTVIGNPLSNYWWMTVIGCPLGNHWWMTVIGSPLGNHWWITVVDLFSLQLWPVPGVRIPHFCLHHQPWPLWPHTQWRSATRTAALLIRRLACWLLLTHHFALQQYLLLHLASPAAAGLRPSPWDTQTGQGGGWLHQGQGKSKETASQICPSLPFQNTRMLPLSHHSPETHIQRDACVYARTHTHTHTHLL